MSPFVKSPAMPPAGVLLDLDGTLLDTAPDLIDALNQLRVEESLPPLPSEQVRPEVSNGARAVVRVGFPDADPAPFESLCGRFLQLYRGCVAVHSRLFPGFDVVLRQLETHAIPWGIVTNKSGWLTEPLLIELGLMQRAACVVSGDTLPERKPHPRPLLVAAERMGVTASRCLYVGDALRDMQAARDAGMTGLVARYGYIGAHERPELWPAAGMIATPAGLLPWVGLDESTAARCAGDA